MSDFMHSEALFREKDGKGMKFYMRPCSEKQRLRPIIEHGGGSLTSKWTDGIYRLISSENKKLTETGISSKFIDDCVEQNRLLDMSVYEIKSNDTVVSDISDDDCKYQIQTVARNTRARREYTRQDDELIIDYVIKTKGFNEVKGRRYWREMEDRKVLPKRTWQSLKERFVKKIIPNIHTFNLDPKQRKAFQRPFGCVSSDDSMSGDENYEFSQKDDLAIIKYLLDDENYLRIRKASVWQELEQKSIMCCPWVLLRDRFFDTIVPSIHKYKLSSSDLNKFNKVIKIPQSVISDTERLNTEKLNFSDKICASSLNNKHLKIPSPEKTNKIEEVSKGDKILDLSKTKSNDTDLEKPDHQQNSKFPGISWTVVLQADEPHLLCRGSLLDEADAKNKSNKNDKHLKSSSCNTETKSSENISCLSSTDLLSETSDKNRKPRGSKNKKIDKTHTKSKVLFEKFSMADIEEYLRKQTGEEENDNKELSETSDSSLQNLLIENLRKSLVDKLHGKTDSTDKLLESLKSKKLDNVDSSLILGLYQNEIKTKTEMNSNSKKNDADISIHQDSSSMDADDSDIGMSVTADKISDILSGEWPEKHNNNNKDMNNSPKQIRNYETRSSARKNGRIEENTSERNSLLVNKLREKIKSIVKNSSFNNINALERPSKCRKITDENDIEYTESSELNKSEGNKLSSSFPFSERERKKILYEALLRPRETDPPLEIKLSSSIKVALKQIENIKEMCQNWCKSTNLLNISLPMTLLNEHNEKIRDLYSFVYDIYIMSLSHTILKKSQNDIDVNDILILLKYLITNGGFSIDDISKLMNEDIQWL